MPPFFPSKKYLSSALSDIFSKLHLGYPFPARISKSNIVFSWYHILGVLNVYLLFIGDFTLFTLIKVLSDFHTLQLQLFISEQTSHQWGVSLRI